MGWYAFNVAFDGELHYYSDQYIEDAFTRGFWRLDSELAPTKRKVTNATDGEKKAKTVSGPTSASTPIPYPKKSLDYIDKPFTVHMPETFAEDNDRNRIGMEGRIVDGPHLLHDAVENYTCSTIAEYEQFRENPSMGWYAFNVAFDGELHYYSDQYVEEAFTRGFWRLDSELAPA